MKKIFILLIGLSLLVQTSATALAGFSDVPENHKYAQDIQYLENLGIVQENEFKPNEPVSREIFAKWLLKNTGFNPENYTPKIKTRFKDVKFTKKDAYAPYIYKLAELDAFELQKGKINLFNPQEPIKKKEALLWLFVVEGINVPKVFDEALFQATDVKPNSKIAPLIDKAQKLGLLNAGKTYPFGKLKRGEAAHFLKIAKKSVPTLTVTIQPSIESDVLRNPKFDILAGVWNKIFDSYLHKDNADKNALVYGAIEGIVKELKDKHSDFERPGDNALLETLSGEIEGIGAVVQMKDDEVVVVSPIVGSPAERAGLLPEDIITHVDDVDVKGMTLNAVVAKIKGKKGTQVKLTIRRSGTIMNFTITRDVVKIVSATQERTTDNIAKITLNNFGSNTETEFQTIADNIKKDPPKGIVLDLRNNPGGYLATAVHLGGYFIAAGEKVARVRYPEREESHKSSGNAELAKYKIAVIVNKGSASASEIIAGALQDYGIAKIIGAQTYGKGSVQELSDFSDGSTLKLTVAEWLTPNGRSIEKDGITPDIAVEITEADRKAGKDPQMDKALEELRK